VLNYARDLDGLASRVGRAVRHRLAGAKQLLAAVAGQLESLSPLAILGRGYSLTVRDPDGQLIDDAERLNPGDVIRTRFARGQAVSEVKHIEPGM
jgi:exodeoxyribonuclease VII large subunit